MRKSILCLWMCIAVSISAPAQYGNDNADEEQKFVSKLKFEDFRSPVFKGKMAKVNINSSRTARLYRTALRASYTKAKQVDFAGHYVLVSWGCGSPCAAGAIVDVKNGKVYDIPRSGSGYESRKDSRMLIINPPGRHATGKGLYFFKNRPYEVPEIYIFNEATKKFKKRKY